MYQMHSEISYTYSVIRGTIICHDFLLLIQTIFARQNVFQHRPATP
jgi:hypothetical protein